MSKKKENSETSKKPESKYNASLLRESIKNGATAEELIQLFQIKNRQTLKHYVLKLCTEDRTFYEIKGLYLKSSTRPKINPKGHIKLYLKMNELESNGFKEGDEFQIIYEENKIILQKIS